MIAFVFSVLLASAYQPYVRPLRRPHQYQYPTMPYFPGFEWGDLEDYLPYIGGMFSQPTQSSSSSQGTQSQQANPSMNPFGAYMNNPYGLNMQKCMDNDMCTTWVQQNQFSHSSGGYSG